LFKPVEYEILDKWFNFMTNSHDCGLDIIFYLRTNPETCLKRLNQRARNEETNRVTIEYLQQLHDFHEEWLIDGNQNIASATASPSPANSSKKFYRPPSVIVIDANKKLDEVYEIIENATKNAILEIANN
jgi:thymidylate kinase